MMIFKRETLKQKKQPRKTETKNTQKKQAKL